MKAFYNYFGVLPWLGVFLLGLLLAACDGCLAQEAMSTNTGDSVTPVAVAEKTDSTTLTVTGATLFAVHVTPIRAKLQMGITQGLLASALFSDGSVWDVTTTAVWTSHAPLVAAVVAGTGVVTGISAGSAQVTATFGGKAAVAGVTVLDAALMEIALVPATVTAQTGDTTQFVAMGTFSDGSHGLLGAAAVWSSSNPLVASVAPTSGLASALSTGTARITATWDGKTATAVLSVFAAAGRVGTPP